MKQQQVVELSSNVGYLRMRCASESDHKTSAIPHLRLIHTRSVSKVGPLSQAIISSIIIMFCVESIS